MLKKFYLFIAAILLFSTGTNAETNRAWKVGEKLEYRVYYAFFNAGTSTFLVEKEYQSSGRNIVQFKSVIQSRSNFFVKIFDEALSVSDANSYASLRYEKNQRERNEFSKNVTVFNNAAGQALRTEDGHAYPPMNYRRGSMDVLSAIYYVRSQDLSIGKTYTIPVHDGKRDYTMRVKAVGRETVKTPAGTFDALKVEPKLYGEDGKLSKSGQMTLWMTDDDLHIPVRIRISLKFGSMTADLLRSSGTK